MVIKQQSEPLSMPDKPGHKIGPMQRYLSDCKESLAPTASTSMSIEPGHIFYCEWCQHLIDVSYAEHYGHGEHADLCKAYDRHLRRAIKEAARREGK